MNYINQNYTDKIPLVVAFTPNYFVPAATCLYSILKHSYETDLFHVIVLLSEELPDQMKQKLDRLGGDRMIFSYMNLDGQLGDIYVNEKYTVAASYRLLLPNILPNYDKVLYIDCDVVVRNNLAELYRKVDLQGNYLAGVFEATLDFQIPHLHAIGCNPGEYINSGFLIMNLELLRKDDMVTKFLNASKAEYLEFPDQDVLNQLCKGKILKLPPIYNSIRTFYLPQYKSNFMMYYSEEDWNEVQEHGTIHYTGAKPWNTFTVQFDVWWNYYMSLPKEIREHEQMNKKVYFLYLILGNSFGKVVIGFLQRIYRRLRY